jgi:hypothetical protein
MRASLSISPNRMPPARLRPWNIHEPFWKISSRRAAHLNRLTGYWIDRTSCTDLELVEYHVTQSLVVDHADIDVRSKFLSSYAGVHRFIAKTIVSRSQELFAEIINRSILFCKSGRCCINTHNRYK